jgi:hypothetical protein
MVLMGLKRMRFVDQIQMLVQSHFPPGYAIFLGDWLSWESAESLTTRVFFSQFEAF